MLTALEPPGADVVGREWARQQRGESILFVARIGGAPAGRGELVPGDSPELRNLHVRPEFQRRGVGSAIAAAAEGAVARAGGTRLSVGVALDNGGARRLYERLGYRATGELTTTTYTYVDGDGEHVATETDERLVKALEPPVLGTLRTPRLVLRPRIVEDAEVLRHLWTERDPRVPPHRQIDAQGRPTVEDIAAGILREGESPRPGLLTVRRQVEDDVIGYCGLVFHSYEGPGPAGGLHRQGAPNAEIATGEPELAFELLRDVHGRGYATEAGQAVIDWATEAGYERLWATVRAWNAASRRVLNKLGFNETGVVEHDDVHGDSLLTVLRLDPHPAPRRGARPGSTSSPSP